MWSSKEVIRVIIEAGSGFAAVMFAVDKFMSAAHSDQRAKDGDCRIAHTGTRLMELPKYSGKRVQAPACTDQEVRVNAAPFRIGDLNHDPYLARGQPQHEADC